MMLISLDTWLIAHVFQPILNRTGADPYPIALFLVSGNIFLQSIAVFLSWPTLSSMLLFSSCAVIFSVSYIDLHRLEITPEIGRLLWLPRAILLSVWLVQVLLLLMVAVLVGFVSGASVACCSGLGLHVAAYFFLGCGKPPPRKKKLPVGKTVFQT